MHKSFSEIITSKPAVVFDLDDTLVHVTLLPPINLDKKNYFTITVKRRRFYVQMRPYLHYFLERISKIYDIYIFTASNKEYANLIIDKILPNVKESHRFYKNSCIMVNGYFVKNLNIIGRPIQKILLIDDSSGSGLTNPKNLVKIKPWNGEKNDNVLKDLLLLLEEIAYDNDLRISFEEFVKKSKLDGIVFFQ